MTTASAQPSFDCRRAGTAAERIICRDDALAQGDRAIAHLYGTLRAHQPALRGQLLADQRRFLAQRDACGRNRDCIAGHMITRIHALKAQQQAQPESAAAAPRTCEQRLETARGIADRVAVSAESMEQGTGVAGGEIEVIWSNTNGPAEGLPLYLVIDVPAEIRFAGMDFLALTAGAEGPHGISIANDRARAIVPLHKAQVGQGGQVYVMPWRAGHMQIGWTVATAGPCGEHVLASRQSVGFSVGLGSPQLVVQDPFADDRPERRIRDRSGSFDLLVFDGHYEVRDAVQGGRIVRRQGYDPNFSPTGRFVAARNRVDHTLEIVDLVSGQLVLEFQPGLLAWARNDSLVIHSATRFGNVGYAWTLGAHVPTTNPDMIAKDTRLFGAACNQCRGWNDAEVILNLDDGFFAVIVTMSSAVQDLIGGHKDKFDSRVVSIGQGVDDRVRAEMYRRIRNAYGVEVKLVPRRWDLGEPLQLSHVEVFLGGDDVGRPLDRSQLTFLVEHENIPPSQMDSTGSEVVVERTPVSMEVMFDRIAVALATERPAAGIETQLEAFEPPYHIAPTPDHRTAVQGLVDRMVRGIPSLTSHLREAEDSSCSAVHAEALDPTYIKHAWSWTSNGSSRYILEVECIAGTMQLVYGSYLLASTDASQPLIGLDGALVADEATDSNGASVLLAGHGNILGVFPSGRGEVLIVDPASGVAALVDETSGERIGGLIRLEAPGLVESMRLSSDRRHIVQLNRDGSFYVYEAATGEAVLIGAHVDDEIVVMTPDGRYDTSFEGAHALQIRFQGTPRLFTVHQFASALSRPGLAAAVLSGAEVAPRDGTLPAPPIIELQLGKVGPQGQRSGTVLARSTADLERIQIFIDGRLVQDTSVSGREAKVDFDFPDPGGGRWVTAVAFDSLGLASQPSAVRLLGPPRPNGTYRAIAIGVDRYPADPAIHDLDFAAADARRFASAIEAVEGRAAAHVETTLLLDDAATQDSVLHAIRMAAQATEPDDVLLVFYAGHGANGQAFANSTTDELALTVSHSRIEDLATTAIPWSALAQAIDDARGTVVVVLDACHAGLAGSEAFVSHDDAVSALFTASGAPLVVLAASKGRQVAIENPADGGGYFTLALAETITAGQEAFTRDGNGLISVSELYRAVKTHVSRTTEGVQTPWMARNGLVGDIALF